MSRVIHFDLSAEDPERAAHFYKRVFDWEVEKWQGPWDYWLIKNAAGDGPGITGGIASRIEPADTTAVIIDVSSVDELAKKVQACGGEIRESKRAIPGVGYLVMARIPKETLSDSCSSTSRQHDPR